VAVLARDQDYALLVGPPGTELAVAAHADGRPLCSVCAGGFIGLWIGVYATSNGNPTETVVQVDRFEYESLD
jgi:alpha-N-arabinofuranosidase